MNETQVLIEVSGGVAYPHSVGPVDVYVWDWDTYNILAPEEQADYRADFDGIAAQLRAVIATP